MPTPEEVFAELKSLLELDGADISRLVSLQPVFVRHGQRITDDFYTRLGENPTTAALIEGRVEALKATHRVWMLELFGGQYGEEYLQRRLRIGMAHVRVGLPPMYVEAVMHHVRAAGERVIHDTFADPAEATANVTSLYKILDIDLALINLAYNEARLDLVSTQTGMKRALIENLIKQGGKKGR
ncbi:protoglobin domain-containing protein [Myxococcota bacterium]|nr:protoglobin domain-containing protein [Myxococcota bacterium]